MKMFSRISRIFFRKLNITSIKTERKFYSNTIKRRSKLRDVITPFMFGVTIYNNSDMEDHNLDYNFLNTNYGLEEDIMRKAFTSPEPELVELMDVLKDCIIESCEQYRTCIKKQIELIEKSSQVGMFSDSLDDLPEYRTLASDLNHELNNYIVLLKTVGEMTYQHMLASVKEGSIQNVNLISEKYKNLEVILQQQLDENRKCESELNYANRNMILNTKVEY